jgi:uncharacterized membrane protein
VTFNIHERLWSRADKARDLKAQALVSTAPPASSPPALA